MKPSPGTPRGGLWGTRWNLGGVVWHIFSFTKRDGPRSDDAEGVGKGAGDAYQRRLRSSQEGPKHRGVEVAIYRTLFYGDVTVGTGGRMTIPRSMRDSCGIRAGDTLTVRVEENPEGIRQLVLWRAKSDQDDI